MNQRIMIESLKAVEILFLDGGFNVWGTPGSIAWGQKVYGKNK